MDQKGSKLKVRLGGKHISPSSRLKLKANMRDSGIPWHLTVATVEAMGGEVWLESEGQGKGCTF